MKTLDDIIPPSRRAAAPEPESPRPPESPRMRRRSGFPLGTLIVVLFIIALSVGTLFYFSNAQVKVTPFTHVAVLTATPFTAVATPGDSALTFEVITAEKIESQSVTSSGMNTVQSSARGTITIYNTQNKAQKLIANTRFQSTGGLVYRIHSAVTIPAAKGGTPGSITATVFADTAGSQYNIAPTTFTLPGLSGSPQFTAVTAKSTTAIAGGSSGNEPTVTPETESAARAALMDKLRSDLATVLDAKVPEGYTLLAGASDIAFTAMPTTPGASAGMADLKEKGVVRGVIFPNKALAKAIAESVLKSEYKGEELTISEAKSVVLKPIEQIPESANANFMFTLSGQATLQSVILPARISSAIAGKTRDEAGTILHQYPEVKDALLILRPFWRSSFPQDPAGIKVEVVEAVGN